MRRNNIDHDILFEDNHLIVFNKQPSDIVQGDKTGDIPLSDLLKEYLKVKYHKPGNVFLGVVHRLDRPVSGALLFARTSKSLSRLNAMLREGGIRKTYWAIVRNEPPAPSGHLRQYISRNEQQNKSYVHDHPGRDRQTAELTYTVIDHSDRYYLLAVNLITGRHHQIRAQLAAMGCPIRGDLKYGYPRSNPDGSVSLHSLRIELTHPVKLEPVRVVAPLPQEKLWEIFAGNLKPEAE